MPRPTNPENYSPQKQREQLQVLCGEAIAQLRKQIKKADANTLARFVVQVLPLVLNEDTQTTSDVTMEILTKKALKVQLSVQKATEAQQASEEIATEEETSNETVSENAPH
mgnify:FL=1